MESLIKIAFAGYSEYFDAYKKAIGRIAELSFVGAWFEDVCPNDYTEVQFDSLSQLIQETDVVFFFGDRIKKKHLVQAIKALKHIFIDDYSTLMNSGFHDFETLSMEANIIAQVSFPKTYYWGIKDLAKEYPTIRHLSFYRECPYNQNKLDVEVYAEILCATKLIDAEISRVNQTSTPMIVKRSQMKSIQIEFTNGSLVNITSIPIGFFDCHEMRIIADKQMAYVDLRKREWHSLDTERKSTTLIKGLCNLPEVGDTEYFELQEFVSCIRLNTQPFISFNDIARLHKCVELLNEL